MEATAAARGSRALTDGDRRVPARPAHARTRAIEQVRVERVEAEERHADSSTCIHMDRDNSHADTASVTEGSVQIAMMRLAQVAVPGLPALILDDATGHHVACVHIPCVRRFRELVDLILEVPDGTSKQLRAVALAGSLIAERELFDLGGGG